MVSLLFDAAVGVAADVDHRRAGGNGGKSGLLALSILTTMSFDNGVSAGDEVGK